MEKCYEYNIDIYNVFIDYSHAFDSIIRESILTSLHSNKISPKLINLIKLTLENTTVKVKVNNNYTSDFRVDIGVKQGDPLSPILFNLIIDTVLTQLDLRGNIFTFLKQLMAYADDILILTRTKKSQTEALQHLKKSSIEVGLKTNEEKSKYLKCSKKDTKKIDLNWQNLSIEQVHQYIYLRSIINDNSK